MALTHAKLASLGLALVDVDAALGGEEEGDLAAERRTGGGRSGAASSSMQDDAGGGAADAGVVDAVEAVRRGEKADERLVTADERCIER